MFYTEVSHFFISAGPNRCAGLTARMQMGQNNGETTL